MTEHGLALAAFATAWIACHAFAALARRVGWLDAPKGDEAARKLQGAPVPPVAGAAIFVAWALVIVWTGGPGFYAPLLPGELFLLPNTAQREIVRIAIVLALVAAFAVGTLDDVRRGGLSPAVKFGGQLAAGAVLALPCWFHGAELVWSTAAFGTTLLCAFAAAIALNALNTFDNADGAASGVGALGLGAAGAFVLGAGVAGVVPPGLLLRRRASGTPLVYLGDGGSHLVGMALLVVPGAWPALGLPLLDLARVALERVRAGTPPWRGDRRHLAHRLQRCGLGPRTVALLLWIVAASPLLVPGVLGWSLLLVGFSALVLWSSRACDDGVRSR